MAKDYIVEIYKGLGNTAKIEKITGKKAFLDDKLKKDTYRVIFSQDFEGNFVYHVICFETLKEAQSHVAEYPFFVKVV